MAFVVVMRKILSLVCVRVSGLHFNHVICHVTLAYYISLVYIHSSLSCQPYYSLTLRLRPAYLGHINKRIGLSYIPMPVPLPSTSIFCSVPRRFRGVVTIVILSIPSSRAIKRGIQNERVF